MFVSSYEKLKFEFGSRDWIHGTPQHLVCAAIAGSSAGIITTPLDVIKTRIQTDKVLVQRGMLSAFQMAVSAIKKEEGMFGFTRGAMARALYFAPSAAIVWSTYEIVKRVFGIELEGSDDMVPI
jgi:hypothetical protein